MELSHNKNQTFTSGRWKRENGLGFHRTELISIKAHCALIGPSPNCDNLTSCKNLRGQRLSAGTFSTSNRSLNLSRSQFAFSALPNNPSSSFRGKGRAAFPTGAESTAHLQAGTRAILIQHALPMHPGSLLQQSPQAAHFFEGENAWFWSRHSLRWS
jgi:hypothetical protein